MTNVTAIPPPSLTQATPTSAQPLMASAMWVKKWIPEGECVAVGKVKADNSEFSYLYYSKIECKGNRYEEVSFWDKTCTKPFHYTDVATFECTGSNEDGRLSSTESTCVQSRAAQTAASQHHYGVSDDHID